MFERTRQGTVNIVGGPDPISASTAEELTRLLDECVQKGQPRIVMNLESVPLIDSEGLELLLKTGERCEERCGIMHLAAPNSLCQDILRVTGVDQNFDLFDDVTEAVRSFAR